MSNVKRRAALVLAVLATVAAFAGPAHANDTSSSTTTTTQSGLQRGR